MERKIEKLKYIFYPILILFVPLYYGIFLLLKWLRSSKQKKFKNVKIVCIGNATLGGSGKTTLVKKLAEDLKKQNKQVAIATRGYKRKCKLDVLLKPDYNYPANHVEIFGDEPFMLFSELKVPISVSFDRLKAIQKLVDNYPDIKTIISDDGYQNFTFYKDINVLLINVYDIIKNNLFIFPLGNLREPLKAALKRSNFVVFTHCEIVSSRVLKKVKERILKIKPDIKLITSFYQIKSFVDIYSGNSFTLSEFRWLNNKIAICCAIGNPESFVEMLRIEGFEIKHKFFYSDHHWYSKQDIEKIRKKTNLAVVTTSKDAVKIKPLFEVLKKSYVENFYSCEVELKIVEGQNSWTELINSL